MVSAADVTPNGAYRAPILAELVTILVVEPPEFAEIGDEIEYEKEYTTEVSDVQQDIKKASTIECIKI